MKAAEFKDWIKSIERMSRGQRDKLRGRLEGRVGVDTILELIEQGQNDQNDERICPYCCLLYTSDAADERSSVDLGGRRIIKKKQNEE